MRSGLEERRERGSFGLSTAVGRLGNQSLKGVGARSGSKVPANVCPAMPPRGSELTKVFWRSGVILPPPMELLAGCRQFAPPPPPAAHKPRKNSKSLPAESNSSKRGLTIRGRSEERRVGKECRSRWSP